MWNEAVATQLALAALTGQACSRHGRSRDLNSSTLTSSANLSTEMFSSAMLDLRFELANPFRATFRRDGWRRGQDLHRHKSRATERVSLVHEGNRLSGEEF
jgi:hypothetical protein